MNHTLRIYISILFLVALYSGCNEVYYPEGIDSSQKLIVINGKLDDLKGLVSVSVYHAAPFNDKSKYAISNALVSLRDNAGHSFSLHEKSYQSGWYELQLDPNELSRYVQYYLHVETPEGKIYESDPQKFPNEIGIEDLEAEIGQNTVVSTSSSGEILTQTFDGLWLYITAKSLDDNVKYIRFENIAIYQSQYWTSPPMSSSPIPTYCVNYSSLSNLPAVEATFSDDNVQRISHKETGFVSYYVDNSTQNDTTSPRSVVGWVIQCNAYSISAETYDYYTKIKKQLAADNKIFDPIPSQILGNIKSISDPSEIALGIFEVNRKVERTYGFSWMPGSETVIKMEITDYDAPNGSFCTDSVPDYDWIDFR